MFVITWLSHFMRLSLSGYLTCNSRHLNKWWPQSQTLIARCYQSASLKHRLIKIKPFFLVSPCIWLAVVAVVKLSSPCCQLLPVPPPCSHQHSQTRSAEPFEIEPLLSTSSLQSCHEDYKQNKMLTRRILSECYLALFWIWFRQNTTWPTLQCKCKCYQLKCWEHAHKLHLERHLLTCKDTALLHVQHLVELFDDPSRNDPVNCLAWTQRALGGIVSSCALDVIKILVQRFELAVSDAGCKLPKILITGLLDHLTHNWSDHFPHQPRNKSLVCNREMFMTIVGSEQCSLSPWSPEVFSTWRKTEQMLTISWYKRSLISSLANFVWNAELFVQCEVKAWWLWVSQGMEDGASKNMSLLR